jgi:replicative DNA helicase
MTNDVGAERAVLAGLFRCGFAAYADVSDILSSEAFTLDANRAFYAAFGRFYEREENRNRTPDSPTVMSLVAEMGLGHLFEEREKKAVELLRAVANFPATLENVRPTAKRLMKLHVVRMLAGECEAAAEDVRAFTGSETVSQILGAAEGRILDFAQKYGGDGDEVVKIGSLSREYYERLKATARPSGIRVGWSHWEACIGGGLLPNALDLIVARAKCGKSLASLNMTISLIRQGIPVLYVDTEMTKEEQTRRAWSTLSQVPERQIRDGEFVGDAKKEQALEAAVAELEANDLFHHRYVGDRTPEEIIALIRRWLVKDVGLDEHGYARPCVVFYDYIKLMNADDLQKGGMAEHQSIGFITIGLKNLMAKYNARCVAFAQQNREGLDSDDERGIALSDRLTWFPTSVTILRWQTEDELAAQVDPAVPGGPPPYSHKLIPILSRHGGRWPRGESIFVQTNLNTCTMKEGPRSDQYRSGLKANGVTF